MTETLFSDLAAERINGPMRQALEDYLAAADGVPGPMAEHARFLADTIDGEAHTNQVWARAGRPVPSGVLMAQCQVSREFRDTFAAVHKSAGGGDDDPAARLFAQLAAPLVGDASRS